MEPEVDIAAKALGQGVRAVAGSSRIRDLAAAERAVDNQADLLGDELLAGLGLRSGIQAGGSRRATRRSWRRYDESSWVRVMMDSSSRAGPVPALPAHTSLAAGAHREGARRSRARGVLRVKKVRMAGCRPG